jgi:hypothetical protein
LRKGIAFRLISRINRYEYAKEETKMKKIVLAAALIAVPAAYSGANAAQELGYGSEVCVNASLADEARRLFPKASLHILPDFPDASMNGWRIVSGNVRPDGKIMTDAEERKVRVREENRRFTGE